MLDELRAHARYKPWLDRRIHVTEVTTLLRPHGWSSLVERVLVLGAQPILVRALIGALTAAGATEADAICAIESARVARMLGWSP